jgi:hypothetical protein
MLNISRLAKNNNSRGNGYPSIDALSAGSTFVKLSDGATWWLTKDRSGNWTAWNLCAVDGQ